MQIDFKKKTVLITGGTRGIGGSLVDGFFQNGATVYATGTDENVIRQLNNTAEAIDSRRKYLCLDFTVEESIVQLKNALEKVKIDILINCAGVNRINPIDEVRDEDWDWLNTVNLRGAYLITKFVSAKMKKQKSGRIVNIASIWGVISKEKRSVYSSTKWGLIGLTKGVALDLGPYNILVNSVSPGFVNTELTKQILTEAERKKLAGEVPLQRFADPSEISQVVMFLASEQNTYISGQNIVVDGGFTGQ
jgi:3-oxoacyl-[acyl-carrier protein] reductase